MSLGARPPKSTSTGLSEGTDAFLAKLMKKNGMSQRKQKEMIEQIQSEGALPRPAKPKTWKQETKPRPEQKVFTRARVGQRPLVKLEGAIIEETEWYAREQAPTVPLGPSSEARKGELVSKMWGVDEKAQKREREAALSAAHEMLPRTMDDQIIDEIRGRTEWLEEMHELGVHEHDGETLRQIDQRMDELKGRRKPNNAE